MKAYLLALCLTISSFLGAVAAPTGLTSTTGYVDGTVALLWNYVPADQQWYIYVNGVLKAAPTRAQISLSGSTKVSYVVSNFSPTLLPATVYINAIQNAVVSAASSSITIAAQAAPTPGATSTPIAFPTPLTWTAVTVMNLTPQYTPVPYPTAVTYTSATVLNWPTPMPTSTPIAWPTPVPTYAVVWPTPNPTATPIAWPTPLTWTAVTVMNLTPQFTQIPNPTAVAIQAVAVTTFSAPWPTPGALVVVATPQAAWRTDSGGVYANNSAPVFDYDANSFTATTRRGAPTVNGYLATSGTTTVFTGYGLLYGWGITDPSTVMNSRVTLFDGAVTRQVLSAEVVQPYILPRGMAFTTGMVIKIDGVAFDGAFWWEHSR